MKESDIWTVGLDIQPGANPLSEADLGGRLAIVVGNEGKGSAGSRAEKCDFCVTIPMKGSVDSLNAAMPAVSFSTAHSRRASTA